MVKEWGMSDKVGRVAISEPSCGGPFMGMQMMRRSAQWGNKILGTVEEEVERLVNNSYLIAKSVLTKKKDLSTMLLSDKRRTGISFLSRACLLLRK
eukprot:CAMPEP_0198137352 /NCGR_PEP_ID=MMETSP1443-20131203/864_1 /TAXON_ID=186043 /ORGANISM="Entomoneis sp., Strain CCMP2396" /LENGTH=95 /DNA_ID=CAMNT_0043798757 /DNA_START=1 /DNA_END=285 /DNA_ORIENTATION=-